MANGANGIGFNELSRYNQCATAGNPDNVKKSTEAAARADEAFLAKLAAERDGLKGRVAVITDPEN